MSGSGFVSKSTFLTRDASEVVSISQNRSEKIARWVSDYFSPPVMAAATLLMVAIFAGTSVIWGSIGVFLLVGIGFPTLYVFWLVKKKKVSDFHIPIRSQRIRPMVFMLVTTVISLFLLIGLHTPRFVMILSLAAFGQLIIIFVITLKWKISGHAAAVSTFSALCWLFYGSLAGFVFILIPIVIWARLRLKRHTPMQTLAGTVLGLLTLVAIIFIL
jgi:membrane-associated phospholipid phosphatase